MFLLKELSVVSMAVLVLTARLDAATEMVDGTTGIPLGGVGAGAIKFCPYMGSFAVATMTPVAHDNFAKLDNTCFQFFSRRGANVTTSHLLTSVQVNDHYDDDAFFPVESANFGVIDHTEIRLTAFSPIDFSSLEGMSHPQAFFCLKVTNIDSTEVAVACALQMGTSVTPTGIPGKGFKTAGGVEYAVYAASDDPAAEISYGNDPGFDLTGTCDNTLSGNLNKTAVKVTLKPHETKTLRFVITWYNGIPGKDYFADRFHYVTAGASAADFAEEGLKNFDALMKNAVDLATRLRASNLPEWLKNQTANSLCNLSNNWVYTKDGRMACAEGQWPYMGTMDQMWHARPIYVAISPEMTWQELQYWARTQKTSPEGQIHHDFCAPDGGSQSLVPWDDQQHKDYREIDNWVDLNCGFIISFYEAFIATDDRRQLAYFWPYLKKTGQRILTQSTTLAMAKYPGTFNDSGSTYDAGGNSDAYNSGLSLVAYTIMSQMSALEGDSSLQATYDQALATTKTSFQARWLDPRLRNFPYGRITEGVLTGQQMGYRLKFDSFFPQANLDYGLSVLTECYDPINGLHHPEGTYDEWAEYIMMHLGDLLLQTGRVQEWRALQHDYYQRCYQDRDITFDTELGIPKLPVKPTYPATSFGGAGQYISNPDLWRNYDEIIGFHRNKVTGELWLEPHLPDEMNHVLQDGLFLSPKGMGTISTVESGPANQNQAITLKPDAPMAVSKLYLKDLYGTKIDSVTVNGTKAEFTRIGSGYGRKLQINWNATIPPEGVHIEVKGEAVGAGTELRTAFHPIFAKDGAAFSGGTPATNTESSPNDRIFAVQAIDDNGGGIGVRFFGDRKGMTFDKLDFEAGADSLLVRYSSPAEGKLEVHLENPAGPVIASGVLAKTESWQTMTLPVSGAMGVHSLYLAVTAGTGNEIDLNWMEFARTVHPKKAYDATDQIEAEDYDVMNGKLGVFTCADTTDSKTTTNITSGDSIGFQGIDFGNGVNGFDARVASNTQGGMIEAHLDSLTGTLLGTCAVPGTGGWDSWKTVSCPVAAENVRGVHAVYLVFTGAPGFLFNLNWFHFEKSNPKAK